MFELLNVGTEAGGRIVTLRFDHGKANEVGAAVLAELEQLPTYLKQVGAVALITYSERRTSKGTPIFVAGANVSERSDWSTAQIKQHVRWQRKVLGAIRSAPVFHIGVVSGVALGWGTEYLLCCDYRIGCPGASFALPETGLGILPGAGGSSELWAQIGVAQTLRLGMTGERIDADEASRIGLIQEVVTDLPSGLERARSLASLVTKRSPTALALFKGAVLGAVGERQLVRQEREALAYEACVDSGQAAIGREHFAAIRKGEIPPW